jgi:hypothetical protein
MRYQLSMLYGWINANYELEMLRTDAIVDVFMLFISMVIRNIYDF